MSAEELMSAGYNIEPSYKPYISSEELLDTCSRQLVGKEPRPVNELMAIVRKVGGDLHC